MRLLRGFDTNNAHTATEPRSALPSRRVSAAAECTYSVGEITWFSARVRRGPYVAAIRDSMGDRQSLVVASDASLAASGRDDHVVRTMLDMISCLERAGSRLVTVILRGDFARDLELAGFLRETYPTVEIVPAAG